MAHYAGLPKTWQNNDDLSATVLATEVYDPINAFCAWDSPTTPGEEWRCSIYQFGRVPTTVNYYRYVRSGTFVSGELNLVANGTGFSAGTPVTIDLPVAANLGQYYPIGSGLYYDSGTGIYQCTVFASGAYAYLCRGDDTRGADNNFIGVWPSITVAPNDIICMSFHYEAVS